jgi:hypothetical protein
MFDHADLPTLQDGYEAVTFLYGQRRTFGIEAIAPVLSALSGDLVREIGSRTEHAPAPGEPAQTAAPLPGMSTAARPPTTS